MPHSAAVETGWGQASLVPLLAPSRADDDRFVSWYRRWERLSSTPSAAAATLRWGMEYDLSPVLPAIRARTLIVRRTGNALFDLESVRATARLIPDARYAELPGNDDLPYVGDAGFRKWMASAHGHADGSPLPAVRAQVSKRRTYLAASAPKPLALRSAFRAASRWEPSHSL